MTKKARANMTVVESVPVREFFDSFKEPLELELVAGEGGWIE